MKFAFTVIGLLALPSLALAIPIKTQMLKSQAKFIEAENHLLEPLDLKAKTLSFHQKEFDLCGSALKRRAQTLSYSCTLEIPSNAKVSILQNLVTPTQLEVNFGGSKRKVHVAVSADARTLTMTTDFDDTGIDFEVSKFNDDFFAVYAKVAQLVISDAMSKQPLRIEVFESH